jgi:hypothetical protein
MRKIMMAAVAAIVTAGVPVAAAADADGPHHRVRHHHAHTYVPYVDADPAVRGGYVMNGNFDWRRRGEPVPWYGHGYDDNCVAWTKDAYHYACDPNSRY